MEAADVDCPEVVENLRNAQKSWERLRRILGQEGVITRVSGIFLKDGGIGGSDFRVGDVGNEPPHWTGPGKFLTWVRKADTGETDKETGGGGLGIPTAGCSNGGDGI